MSITVFVKHGDDQFVSVHVHLDSYVGDLVHASITVLRLAVDPGKVSLRFLLDEVGTGGAILDPTARLSAACVYNESRLIVEVKPSLVGTFTIAWLVGLLSFVHFLSWSAGFRGRSGGGAGGEGSSAGDTSVPRFVQPTVYHNRCTLCRFETLPRLQRIVVA